MAERPVEDLVKALIADEFGIDEDDITTDMKLDGHELDLDSLDRVSLAMELEDSFGIQIADDYVERMQTVGDVIDHVKQEVSRG